MTSHNFKLIQSVLPIPTKPFALFLDIDGTLAPISETPNSAKIPDATLNLLKQLKTSLQGALALVSGRSIDDIDSMTNNPDLTAAGQHGLEIRHDEAGGIITNSKNRKVIQDIQEQVRTFHQDYPQLLIEYKSLSVAVHYRAAPEMHDIVKTLLREVVAPYSKLLTLQEGKMVFEARLRGADKGLAIRQIMQHPPFLRKTPVFAGDDITDEDGFRAVNELGGMSVKVGTGKTIAKYRVKDVEELQFWLAELAA